jgi:type IV pilus assembly protein PilA
LKSAHHEGFTLIELMIVIAILGILAAIALPNFITYRKRAYNTNAAQDAKNTFTASQAYFNDYPAASLPTITPLYSYGFRQASNVTVLISGSQSALQIRTYHSSGDKTYTVSSEGAIN